MISKAHFVHLKNKYPDSLVQASNDGIDVYDAKGNHVIALRKGGDGMIHDMSKEFGCTGEFCNAPIPRDARVHKLNKDGSIGVDDKADERLQKRDKFVGDAGYVESMHQLGKKGWEFNQKGDVSAEPRAPAASPTPPAQ